MKKPNWDDLRLFAEVARAGSFRRAATALKITEPTVSRRIRRLESDLGVKLFRYSGGVTHLTEQGYRVLTHAQAVEYSVNQLGTAVSGPKKTSGRCVLLAGDGIAAYWLPQFLTIFSSIHPNIQVSVISTKERYGQNQTYFDLRLQYGGAPPEELACISLATTHFTLFSSRNYLESHGTPATLEALADHRLVELVDDAHGNGVLSSWLGMGFVPSFSSNSNTSLAEFVRYGGGIGFLPTYAGLLGPGAVPILPEYNFRLPLYLAYERAVGKKPAVRAMIEFLRTVVFDREAMPWFAEDFSPPAPVWQSIYEKLLKEAAKRGHTPPRRPLR